MALSVMLEDVQSSESLDGLTDSKGSCFSTWLTNAVVSSMSSRISH